MNRSFTVYPDTRIWEWVFSVILTLLGVAMLIWPQMCHGSILQVLIAFTGCIPTTLIFIAVGLNGITALIANGKSLSVGPKIRSVASGARGMIWATFVLSMVKVSIIQGHPSPMVFFFGPLTIVEVFVTYRAYLDARTRIRHS